MKTAVMVVAFDRPDYFRRVVNSLERNPEAEDLPFWFFLDHRPASESRQVEEIARVNKIRNKIIIRREENLGTGRNILGGLRRLFDREGYDRVLVFEDDMIVNPQYIGLTLWLSDQYHQYANVGTVQAHAKDPRDREAQLRDVRSLRLTTQHFWGYCMTKPVWEAIKPYMYDYEALFLAGVTSYSRRDHMGIRKWMRSMLSAEPRTPMGERILSVPREFARPYLRQITFGRRYRLLKMVARDAEWARRWAWRLRPTPTGQDAVMNLALQMQGLHRVTTRIPRTRYIGEDGQHSNSAVYAFQGWATSRTFEWPEDEDPRGFAFPWE